MGAELVLVTVFPMLGVHSVPDTRHYDRLLRREAAAFLDGRAAALRPSAGGVQVSTRTTGSYSAGRGLHRLVTETHAGLVVVGPSHRSQAGRIVPGTMAARLAHGAPCPVAVAYAGDVPERLSRIGVGYAPTTDGDEALRAGAALAASSGATLEVIAVAAPLPWMSVIDTEFDGTTLEAAYLEHLAHDLDAAVTALPPSLKVEANTLAGDPVELIAGATERLDLLVCGSRGHGPVGEVLLGSVSNELVEVARCPVLIVPRSSADSSGRAAA
jgi:nucleotide-binding universal stress UspA family protein